MISKGREAGASPAGTSALPESIVYAIAPAARALTVISIALIVGYAYLLEVRGPSWPVWPIEWRAVGELGFLVCALIAPVSAVIAAHCPEWHGR